MERMTCVIKSVVRGIYKRNHDVQLYATRNCGNLVEEQGAWIRVRVKIQARGLVLHRVTRYMIQSLILTIELEGS